MDNFKKDLEDAKKNMMQGAKMVIMDSLLDIQTTAKTPGYVPVKTGTLKRSITHKVADLSSQIIGYIGSNLVYAAIQEYGGQAGRNKSVNIRPKYYLTRAINTNLDKIKKRFAALRIIKR